jgi:NAD(P)H-flavin reductase
VVAFGAASVAHRQSSHSQASKPQIDQIDWAARTEAERKQASEHHPAAAKEASPVAGGKPAYVAPLQFASACVLPTTWTKCKLLSVTPYNHDTSVFEFAVPFGGVGSLKLPTCACLLLKAPGCEHPWKGGGDAIRPYTPISPESRRGSFQLLIKRYQEWGGPRPTAAQGYALHNSYRPAGAVSNHLFDLVPGEASVEFCHKPGNVKLQYPFRGVKKVTMVAVGVGIAPMVQALDKLLNTEGDTTEVVLLYGNRSVKDILLKEKLDAWSVQHKHRFKVVYAVGSRWANVQVGRTVGGVNMGGVVGPNGNESPKTIAEMQRPPTAEGFGQLAAAARACGGNQASVLG